MTRDGPSKGGKTTVERHGREHMREIGAKGFAATVARHYQGDKDSYLKHLRRRSWEHGVGGFIDKLLKEELDNGKTIACREMPVICDPDDDLPW